MGEKLYVLNSGPGAATFNMALDEALLEAAPEIAAPVLRFYGWTEPAASFGYFQKFTEVSALTSLRPLVRRPTGGGIVPHAHDWTHSLVIPPSSPWYQLRAIESYRSIHEWIRQSFETLGVMAVLAQTCRSSAGQCFVGYEKFDVLFQGRKIAGAAQRRTRSGLLIQGSLQPPRDLSREQWQRAMQVVAPGQGFSPEKIELPAWVLGRTEELARAKYAQPGYNEKR